MHETQKRNEVLSLDLRLDDGGTTIDDCCVLGELADELTGESPGVLLDTLIQSLHGKRSEAGLPPMFLTLTLTSINEIGDDRHEQYNPLTGRLDPRESKRIQRELDGLGGGFAPDGIVMTVLRERVEEEQRREAEANADID